MAILSNGVTICPQKSYYSLVTKSLITLSTCILLALLVAYHALEVQVSDSFTFSIQVRFSSFPRNRRIFIFLNAVTEILKFVPVATSLMQSRIKGDRCMMASEIRLQFFYGLVFV